MPRRRVVKKREILPDPKYKDLVVAKFINTMMKQGKKAAAEKQFYGALDLLAKEGLDPLSSFKQALDNVKPILEVRSRRIGGSNYQVPVEIRPARSQALAMRWIIEFARARKGGSMMKRLCAELLDAYNKRGSAMKKREDVHKMAEANKAFAHYRW